MRFKSCSVLTILLLVGSNHARPSKLASPEIVEETVEKASSKVVADDSSSWRPFEPRSSSVMKTDSRNEPVSVKRKTKDLQYMDQSLRTVATQLLNVTNPNESKDTRVNHKNVKIDNLPTSILLVQENKKNENFDDSKLTSEEKSDMELVREINSEINSMGSMGVNFGRPVNSKFGYFESSHPGQAMAMTEEELERELMASSSTRLITAHKNHPTTTGGISTWILLNPPTTTSKPSIMDDENNVEKDVKVQVNLQTKLTTPVEIFETKTATTLGKIISSQSTTPMERITTLTKGTTPSLKRTTTRPTSVTEKPLKNPQTTLKIEKTKITQTTPMPKTSTSGLTTKKQENLVTTPKTTITTKKTGNSNRPTIKPKITTPKATNVTSKPMTTKLSKPVNQTPKPTRRNPTKSPVETTKNPSTSKIEKVTFRPVQMITTPKSLENVEMPIFVTKVKTSFSTNSKTSNSSTFNSTKNEETELNSLDSKLEEDSVKTKKTPTKINNVLKVQLKKPTEPPTSIEIEPIKVNPPVLKIEKIVDKSSLKKNSTKQENSVIFDDSRIDLKFDFNPELTKIEVETSSEPSSVTTKRPHKRKKNKLRRRKPTTIAPQSVANLSTIAVSTTQNPSLTVESSTENVEFHTDLVGIVENSIQESKIVAESKVSPVVSNDNTKNKNKHVEKPIGTQIYNFLSREVMPSFGVMSLVGLGLAGLASYFLYPFGGAIARRNYIVEPNYKYNMDEYGGNYGQNEEEVFSKVLQGMTNQDGKYGGIKDYENNFYRYQQSYDGPYTDGHTTKRIVDPLKYSTVSATNYRPHETTIYDTTKYRNTEFKYPEISTTPNYYERMKKPDFVGKTSGDRQFVVGNVPKEYSYDDANFANKFQVTTENPKTNFQHDFKLTNNPADVSSYGHAEALKSNDDYDELEITPSAVAVEHGPRSLKNDAGKLRRRKRDSVIQFIPSRTEIEKEVEEIEKEEPLSNEIFDIIDSVIPGEVPHEKDTKKITERQEHEKKHTLEKKASGDEILKNQVGPSNEKNGTSPLTTQAPETTTEKIGVTEKSSQPSTTPKIINSTSLDSNSTSTTSTSTTSTTVHSLTIDEINGSSTKSSGIDPENSSIEWFDQTTTQKPHEESFNVFNFVKKIAEVKLRLGVAILKHASEGFARYLGHVQKRINGEE